MSQQDLPNLSMPRGFMGSHAFSWFSMLVFILLAYGLLVRGLRFRRMKELQRSFGYTSRKSLGKMTFDDAAAIHLELSEMEFPFSFLNSTEFALFRTYGIPSVSSLLVSTNQLTSLETVSKRLADTGVLMFEIVGSAPSSPRWLDSVARMNYIHGIYQKAGKISNDDLLYTLSLFTGEPLKWISRYEWRDFTDMEKAALGTFWKGLGEAMSIDFSCLPGHQEGWTDGIQWLEEVLAWGQEYERIHMVPHKDNHKLACATLDYILWPVPQSLMPLGYRMFQSLMDDRLTKAMMLEKPPRGYFTFTETTLALRRLFLRHLALPRPEIWRSRFLDDDVNEFGRFNSKIYGGLPIYIKPTFAWRWNIQAWIFWALGKPIPGDGGDKYIPQGYDIRKVGPRSMAGEGLEQAADLHEALLRRGRCPFRA